MKTYLIISKDEGTIKTISEIIRSSNYTTSLRVRHTNEDGVRLMCNLILKGTALDVIVIEKETEPTCPSAVSVLDLASRVFTPTPLLILIDHNTAISDGLKNRVMKVQAPNANIKTLFSPFCPKNLLDLLVTTDSAEKKI